MAEPVKPWLWEVPKDSAIGKRRLPRKDGYEKASGKTPFVGDIVLPGLLYAKALTSPYAHAEITKIDTSKAKALKGVWDILLYDDPDIKDRWENTIPENDYIIKLLPNVAEFFGHAVGAIVTAESEEVCDRALKLLDVTWKELPFVLDQEEAMKPGAPAAWASTLPLAKDNLHQSAEEEVGDVEEGFKEADKVIEFRITREENNPAGAEPSKAVAQWTGGPGKSGGEYLEAWVKSQVPHHESSCLADLGYVPRGKIEVNCPYSGGTFGGLNWLAGAHMVPQIAAICARRAGRPVQYVWDESNFYCVGDEYGTYDIKVGFKNDGMITAVQCTTIGMRTCGIEKIEECTQCENFKAIHLYPWVNRSPRMCWRDGGPPSMVTNEVFSHVAAALGIPLPELALKNYGVNGHDVAWINEYQKTNGMPVVNTMKAVIDEGKQAIGWDAKWHAPGTKKLPNGKYHGIGVNYNHHWAHVGMLKSYIGLTVLDGVANILGRWGDIGTGRMSSYCAIVAAELGMKYEDVTCRTFKQQPAGYEITRPGGSFGLVTDGPIVYQIAREMKQKILTIVTSPTQQPLSFIPPGKPLFPDKKPEDLDIKDSVVFEKANPSNKKTMKEVSMNWQKRSGFGPGAGKGDAFFCDSLPLTSGMNPSLPPGLQTLHLACQAQFIEVEVDPDTGKVDVTNVVTVNDVGTAVSPEGVNGQQYGGCIMGIEKSVAAEKIYDPMTGVALNDNHVAWAELTSMDVGPVDCHILENKQGYGAYGSYGCSETPCANSINLTGSAVYNAIGKFVEHYPHTPEKVLKVLGKA